MDNISIHIRDLVKMGDGSTGSKLYCVTGCSITALNPQFTHYSSEENKENDENLLGKLASDQEQTNYKTGFHSEGR